MAFFSFKDVFEGGRNMFFLNAHPLIGLTFALSLVVSFLCIRLVHRAYGRRVRFIGIVLGACGIVTCFRMLAQEGIIIRIPLPAMADLAVVLLYLSAILTLLKHEREVLGPYAALRLKEADSPAAPPRPSTLAGVSPGLPQLTSH